MALQHLSVSMNTTITDIEKQGIRPLVSVLNVDKLLHELDEVELDLFDAINFVSIACFICFILKKKYVLHKLNNLYIVVFLVSTVYRSTFISDEGAFLCYKPASVWNSCFGGRMIATFGEFAILNFVLCKLHIDERPRIYYLELALCACAETSSWFGCIMRNSRFFCLEYTFWCLLLSVIICCCRRRRRHSVAICCAKLLFLAIILFNLCVEIPHFWHFQLQRDTSLFRSLQDKENPIWDDRIMFFVGYYNVLPLYLLSTAYSPSS